MENICKAITYLTHLKRMMVTFKEEVGCHECISPEKVKQLGYGCMWIRDVKRSHVAGQVVIDCM